MGNTPRLLLGRAALAVVASAAAALHATPARAWGGVFIGLPPVVVGPPVAAYPPPYYYPPAYYAPAYAYPPPAPVPQPQVSRAEPPFGGTCYAGVYTCAAPAQTPVGSGCSCAGIGAPSYGSVQ